MKSYDYLYDFTSTDLIEFLDDAELTDGLDRLDMLEIAIEQLRNEEARHHND